MANMIVITFGLLLTAHAGVSQLCDSATPVIVQGPSESLASLNYPNNYPSSTDCLYNATVPTGYTLKLSFMSFTLEDPDGSGTCNSDYLELYDTLSPNENSVKFCGSSLPDPVYSKTNWMKLKFHSDGANEYGGYNATIIPVTENDLCPSKAALTANSGTIVTPFYPRNYPPQNKTCTWEMTAPKGKHIKLTFRDFDVFKCGYSCNCDAVELTLGFNSRGDEPGGGELCQRGLNPSGGYDLSKALYSVYNRIEVKFIETASTSHTYKGFKADYEIIDYTPPVCPSVPINFTQASGSISSPNYPKGNYPPSTRCFSLITVASGSRIRLNFTSIDMEGKGCGAFPNNKECTCDYVNVYDGDTTSDPKLGEFCGTTVPESLVNSTGNVMLVEFRSGSSVQLKGFHAVYTSDQGPTSSTSPPTGKAKNCSSDKVAVVFGMILAVGLGLYY